MSFTRYFRGRAIDVPGSYSAIVDDGGLVVTPPNALQPLIIGASDGGPPNEILLLHSPQEALEVLKGGEGVDAVRRAYLTQPDNQPQPNLPYIVQFLRIGNPSQSSLELVDTSPGASEVQHVSLTGATSGTFTLNFGGAITSPLAFGATTGTVQTALQGLTSIGAGNATVAGSAGAWDVTFAGTMADKPEALLIANGASLVGTNEVQALVDTSASAGNFTLTFNGQTTANIAYNAPATGAGSVQTLLSALSNIGVGQVTCTGGPLPSAVTITFTGTMAAAPQALITATSTGLTGGTAVVTQSTLGAPAVVTVSETTHGYAAANPVIKLQSVDYGAYTNGMRITVAAATIAGQGYKLTVGKDADAAMDSFVETTDPVGRGGINLRYIGTGTAPLLTVNGTALTTTLTGGGASDPLVIPFVTYPTLQNVVDRINANVGSAWFASLADDDGSHPSNAMDWQTATPIAGPMTIQYNGTGAAARADVTTDVTGLVLATTVATKPLDNLAIELQAGQYATLVDLAMEITGLAAPSSTDGSGNQTFNGLVYSVVVKAPYINFPPENLTMDYVSNDSSTGLGYADIKSAPVMLIGDFTTTAHFEAVVDFLNEQYGVLFTASILPSVNAGRYPLLSAGPIFFLGGLDHTDAKANWVNALLLAQTADAQVLTVVTPETDIHAMLRGHCVLMSDPVNRRERVAIVGGAAGEVPVEAKSRSRDLGAISQGGDFIQLCYPGIIDQDFNGNTVKVPPYMVASQLVGLTCGLGAGLSKTNQFLHAVGPEVDLSYAQVGDLIRNNICVIEHKKVGAQRGIRVAKDITTYRGPANYLRALFATKLTALMLSRLVREGLEPLIGLPNDRNFEITALHNVQSTLETALALGWIVNGVQTPAYRNISISRDTDTVNIDFEATVSTEVDFIFTTLHLTVFRKGM